MKEKKLIHTHKTYNARQEEMSASYKQYTLPFIQTTSKFWYCIKTVNTLHLRVLSNGFKCL